MSTFNFVEGKDFYLEKGKIILTEEYLKRRGKCCGNFCRHCVFEPMYVKGSTKIHSNK